METKDPLILTRFNMIRWSCLYRLRDIQKKKYLGAAGKEPIHDRPYQCEFETVFR